MTLNKDIYSKGKDRTLYGIKGEKVTIIHESETVCIVENKLGRRFSVNKNDLEN